VTQTQTLVGTLLNDTYRLERLIAQGGMGAVYEASHLRLSRRFAVKVLVAPLDRHPELLNRFRREAEIIAAIGHPHIVDAVDFNHTARGEHYIVMELLEGETLAARLRRQGSFSLVQAAHIIKQAASALQAAHHKGIIHRDLKPHNIFLCNRGRRDDFVKIFDFGVSKVMHSLSKLTKVNVVLGTAVYMAPEQVRGASDLDQRADIYSLGCILHEMLSGRTVFEGETPLAIFRQVTGAKPPPLSSRCPDLPKQVEAVVMRSLAKERRERFDTMLAFWDELAGAMRQAGVEVPETAEERQALWPEAFDEVPTSGVWRGSGAPTGSTASGSGTAATNDLPSSPDPTEALAPSLPGLPAAEPPAGPGGPTDDPTEILDRTPTQAGTASLDQAPTLVSERPRDLARRPGPAARSRQASRSPAPSTREPPAPSTSDWGRWRRAGVAALLTLVLVGLSWMLYWWAVGPGRDDAPPTAVRDGRAP